MIWAPTAPIHMLEALLLSMGWTYVQNLNSIAGSCHGLSERSVPCLMQEQPYGIRYVTDGESVYQFRPVWIDGTYSVYKDGEYYRSDKCSPKDANHVCLKTFTFISNK